MPLVLKLHLVMMSKYIYSMFGVNTLNTFWVMGYIKVLHHDNDNNNNDLAITIAPSFLQNRQAKENKIVYL